jgi:hypothetical protein
MTEPALRPTDRTGGEIHVPNLCDACARLIDPTGETPTCTSFPDGIPEDIILWGESHLTSIAGEDPFELDPAKRDLFEQWRNYHDAGLS